jgi:hypothetical protein
MSIPITQAILDREAVVEKARQRARQEEIACADLGLIVFARMWSAVGRILETDAPLQMQVLKGQLPPGWVALPEAPATDAAAAPTPPTPTERRLDFDE